MKNFAPSKMWFGTCAAALFVSHASASASETGTKTDTSMASGAAGELDNSSGNSGEASDNMATEPEINNLVDALRQAYLTQPSVLSERLKKRASEYNVAAAKSKFGPTLTYDMRYGFESDNTQDTVLGSWHHNSGWSATGTAILNQPIYTFGRNAADFKLAKSRSDYARHSLESAEQQLLLDTLSAYAGVIRDRNAITINEANLTTLTRELSDNVARFRKREVTSTDVQQAGTRVELGREQVLNARRQAAVSEADFIQLTGARPGKLEQPNPLTIPIQSLEDAYAEGERSNPVVLAAYARELVSRAQVDAAEAEFYPRVDVRGSAEVGAVTPYSDQYRQRRLSAQIVLSGTLFDGGQRLARLHEAEAYNDSDWRLIDSALRENRVQIASAWNLWRSQLAAAERLAIAIDDAQKAYDGAVLQEKAGLRSTLEVLDIARDLFNVKSNHNNAVATAYIAQARLLAAMGLLDVSNLLPDDLDIAKLDAFDQRYQDRGRLPLIAPIMKSIDSFATDHGANRSSRDGSHQVGAQPSNTDLDIGPDLVVP